MFVKKASTRTLDVQHHFLGLASRGQTNPFRYRCILTTGPQSKGLLLRFRSHALWTLHTAECHVYEDVQLVEGRIDGYSLIDICNVITSQSGKVLQSMLGVL